MTWSSKSLGSSFQHGIFRMLVRCGMVPAARLLVRPVSFWYALRPSIRARYAAYLAHRFGRLPAWKAFLATAAAYGHFADVLLDRMVLGTTGRLSVRHNEEALATLRAVLDEGHGCMLVSAHFGSWQVSLAGLEKLGRPMNLVQWQDSGDVDRHFFAPGDRHRISIINPREGLSAMVGITNALRRGEIVCMMADRFASFERECVETDFLGGKIRIPSAPWVIASAAGAPVVHTCSIRIGGTVTGMKPLVVRVPAGIRRNPDTLRQLAGTYASWLEKLTEDNPLFFFNFYDMWSLDDDGK